MIFLSVAKSLVLTLLLFALSCSIQTAPTHHLTIGVQGNTPTLIVTSSEIGITPETMGFTKKSVKTDLLQKSLKDLDTKKKSVKTKLNKNHTLFNKKDKLQHLTKPVSKQLSSEERSFKEMKSLVEQDNLKQTFKQSPKNVQAFLKDQETSTLKMKDLKIITTTLATPIKAENAEISTKNLQLTTLPPEKINNIPLTTTPTVTNTQPKEESTMKPQAIVIPPAMSTTLNPKDLHDMTTTINYDEHSNTTTISKAFTKTQTETKVNDFVVSQTVKTTEILQDTTTVIKTENENDNDSSYTQDPVATTENENLWLTTIETKAFTTPTITADISTPPPTLDTLITDNTEATTTQQILSLSLTMTTTATTENVVDDNNNNNKNEQQQPATEYSEIDKLTTAANKRNTNKEAEATDKPENQNDNNNGVVTFKPKHEYTTEKIVMQQTYDAIKSSENPVADIFTATTQESGLNAAISENVQNKMETETITETEDKVTTNSTPLTVTEQQQQQSFATLKTNQDQQETTTTTTLTTESSAKAETTTEAVLKLIDLEKHVLKTIDELKQPSLLMAGQHDNGHDGLKNIKKKQLIDKHYVEALLHNKQDVHVKHSTENEKYLPLTTQVIETSNTAASLTSTTNKPILMPIKHGYLGPILMEEKTFHVIHHSDNGNANRKQHLADIEAQLRKGHFVELKAKTEVFEPQEKHQDNVKDFYDNKNIKNLSLPDKDEMEMQSDQPVQEAEKSIDLKEKYNKMEQIKQNSKKLLKTSNELLKLNKGQESSFEKISLNKTNETKLDLKKELKNQTKTKPETIVEPVKITPIDLTQDFISSTENTEKPLTENFKTEIVLTTTENAVNNSPKTFKQPDLYETAVEEPQESEKQPVVLSTTLFQTMDSVATKMPMVQANTMFTSENNENLTKDNSTKQQTESKISDIQIEVYDSTIDSIVASTNFKDEDNKHHSYSSPKDEESSLGKTTKPPVATIQQERFTQYVIDRMETSTHEPINYSTIQVASGKPEPAAIEIHINVSESFGNESEDLEFSYPQSEYNNNNINERIGELLYEDSKINDNIKLKIPSNSNNNGKELRNDEILVVEIIDTDNITDSSLKEKNKNTDELFITDSKDLYTTPPPPPPPPPYQSNFDRDSDTIFYISNTEVKVGESIPNTKNSNEERKLKLESQFFPANYIASTHPNINSPEESNPTHHLYEEDIILSSSRNQADSLKIYRNRNEPSPPLDVTYVGESIIEVEQSPDTVITTTYAPDQQHSVITPQADVIIQPAILPEISIGVPVIGELPPQIELKEIDFMPNEAQLHRSGIYDDNDNSNNMFNSDIDENTINGGNNNNNNNHDADIVNGNGNNNQRVDESSIQYGGDLIDESADGGFDGVEGSYPFGNPAAVGKSSSSSYSSALMAKLRKQQQQQPNHVADYAHLYVNYGVNNMRKDELSADVKDSGELLLVGNGGNGNINVASVNNNEQNITTFKDFLNKVSMNNSTLPFMSGNLTQNERMSNATAFSVMEDANDLEEKSTEDIINLISLAIGLFIVILPVVVTCSMFWALRYLYKKYHSNITDNGGYADQTETKGPLNEDGVEKGEDISRVARETKMDYNKDGVFVVEVARGIDSKNIPESPVTEGTEKMLSMFDTKQNNGGLGYKVTNEKNCINNEKVQIHSPPPENAEEGPRSLHQIEEVEEPANSPQLNENNDDNEVIGLAYKANTGLSQSDLSTSSSNDSNKGYCYGNQELYVVEQSGYSTTTPTGNVVLKCDVKDVKDDDRNPGNDHYLKHSPDKREESKEKEDIVETARKPKEGGTRTSSGESPAQKQNDKAQEKLESDIVVENKENIHEMEQSNSNVDELKEKHLENCNNEFQNNIKTTTEQPVAVVPQAQNCHIPVEIEVHITPAQIENSKTDESLLPAREEKEALAPAKCVLPVLEATESITEPLVLETISTEIEDTPAIEILPAIDIPVSNKNESLSCKSEEKEKVIENDISDAVEILAVPEKFSDNEVEQNAMNADKISQKDTIALENDTNHCEIKVPNSVTDIATEGAENIGNEKEYNDQENSIILENSRNHYETKVSNNMSEIETKKVEIIENGEDQNDHNELKEEPLNSVEINENSQVVANEISEIKESESEKHQDNSNGENVLESNYIHTNGVSEVEELNLEDGKSTVEPIEEELLKTESLNGYIQSDVESLTNGTPTLPDLVTELKSPQLQNGHVEVEPISSSLTDMENGYDSIMSLPEPPPTTDEQLISDLSDQQMDSLPPPPPPEIFNLKDLPPPLTNGNVDSPQSEESSNFYNTLPPPPPTTLEVTATATTNGKVHASPLTPPASPPAHFTNNLHAGLCSQPIAVDVNGS